MTWLLTDNWRSCVVANDISSPSSTWYLYPFDIFIRDWRGDLLLTVYPAFHCNPQRTRPDPVFCRPRLCLVAPCCVGYGNIDPVMTTLFIYLIWLCSRICYSLGDDVVVRGRCGDIVTYMSVVPVVDDEECCMTLLFPVDDDLVPVLLTPISLQWRYCWWCCWPSRDHLMLISCDCS